MPAAGQSSAAGMTATANVPLGREAAAQIPLIDGHFHVFQWMDPHILIQNMDRLGIRMAGGVAPPTSPDRIAEVAAVLGSRYIRPTGAAQWLALKAEEGVSALENAESPAFRKKLVEIEADLRDHGARAIGEIFVSTLQSAGSPLTHLKVRADAPTLRAMLDLAAKYQRPLNIHAQWDVDTAEETAKLAESNRKARLVLSHCGIFAGASDIRKVFEQHSNIVCDLSHRSPPLVKVQVRQQRMVFDHGFLAGDWRRLIEDYPDRFMIGVDDPRSWRDYEATVASIRFGLLANLTRETAEKVAYRNALVWFGLDAAEFERQSYPAKLTIEAK
jgi:hypothetical protein